LRHASSSFSLFVSSYVVSTSSSARPPPTLSSNAAPPTALYTLSLHDALPICAGPNAGKSFVSTNLAVVIAQTGQRVLVVDADLRDRKSTRLNSSHVSISYAVFCLKKKN